MVKEDEKVNKFWDHHEQYETDLLIDEVVVRQEVCYREKDRRKHQAYIQETEHDLPFGDSFRFQLDSLGRLEEPYEEHKEDLCVDKLHNSLQE